MKSKTTPPFAFEEAMTSLESIVKNLESGDLNLEASVQAFEKGMLLAKDCQKALEHARMKVEKLLQKADGSLDTTPLDE